MTIDINLGLISEHACISSLPCLLQFSTSKIFFKKLVFVTISPLMQLKANKYISRSYQQRLIFSTKHKLLYKIKKLENMSKQKIEGKYNNL